MMHLKDVTVQKTPGTDILSQISTTLPEHKFIAVCGPNGAGKTTLLRTLLNFEKPTTGTIHIDNKEIDQLTQSEYCDYFAWVPAIQVMPFSHTVNEVVNWGVINKHSNQQDRDQIIRNSLELMDVNHLIDRPINSLSQGEQKRVQIARAIASGSKTILLDEPFAPLDHFSCEKLLTWIKQATKTQKHTVIVSIHDIGIILNHSDLAVLMNAGKLVMQGSPIEVLGSPLFAEVMKVKLKITPTPHGLAYFM